MKRFLLLVLAFSILVIPLSNAVGMADNTEESINQGSRIMSQLSDDQLAELFELNGIILPDHLKCGDFRIWIEELEQNPFNPNFRNYRFAADLYEQLRSAVLAYYGISFDGALPNSNRYVLLYSSLYSWDASTMPYYNCYGYALGNTSSFLQVGEPSGVNYNDQQSVFVMADIVEADLKALGKNCVKMSLFAPSSVSGWENLIAMKKETSSPLNDYHFSKFQASGWYHKPGASAILLFNDPPAQNVDWTNERYYYDVVYAPTVYYDSNVVFMLYKTSHGSLVRTYTGDNYHQGARHFYKYAYICDDCGEAVSTIWEFVPCSGPPCNPRHD